ncbi:hypothetical protein [Actinomycetospora chiangmaiensis]|uniref:hypothetical protein n=1 Tax=Actinomycetospora chiangmaiensis TaxID=402650 RepID=UPI00035E3DE2|nr:hypothetical protein [Actinomycetospora chiangmaiensis]
MLSGGIDRATTVEGPAWACQGLDQREGRYPLGVEAPVLAMVSTLVPGLSTLTQYARYFTLYWALAERAERDGLDTEQCRALVRRAEVLLALVTAREPGAHTVRPHGGDRIATGPAP